MMAEERGIPPNPGSNSPMGPHACHLIPLGKENMLEYIHVLGVWTMKDGCFVSRVSPMVSTDGYAVVQDSLRKDVIRELESSSTLIKKRQFEDNILTEKSNLDQSKWEYVGYGIWEDSQTSPGLEEYVIPVQETTKSQSVLNRHVEISTTGKSYSSGITKTLDRSISASSSNGDGRTHFHPSTTTAASSATKELDDLMVSLGKVEAAKATPHPLLLDEMLDNLHIDMNTQGVTSSPKGVCYKCTKPILGQVVTALGRPWHPEVRQSLIIAWRFFCYYIFLI